MPPDQDAESELSKKTQRQIRRYLKHKDAVEQLTPFAESLDEKFAAQKEILLGFADLLTAVDKSYAEYEDRIKMAVRNLELSSSELNEVNSELEKLNLSINAMLDSLGQGLLFFDETGAFSPVYSKACLKIFRKSPAGQKVEDLITLSEQGHEDFNMWLSIIFDHNSAMDFDDLKELAPSQFMNSDNRFIELDYRPMYISENRLSGVLMIATDRTEKMIAEQKLKETEETAQIIMAIAQNRNNFLRFVQDLKSYLSYLKHPPKSYDDYSVMMRNLHTHKGLALIFKMNNLATSLHNAETELKGSDKKTALSDETVAGITEEIKKGVKLAREIFGKDFINSGQVKQVQYADLVAYREMLLEKVKDDSACQELTEFLDHTFMAVPVQSCFGPFEAELSRIAVAQGKAAPVFKYETNDISIIPQPYQELFDSLLHLSRNIADHAIEAQTVRIQKGKNEAATIKISVKKCGDSCFELVIEDDGKGINPDLIREKLTENGMDCSAESDEEVIYHIFDSEFSTQQNVTEISGRGIGMSAIKQNVEALGGEIILKSQVDQGVSVTIRWNEG